MKQFKLPKEFAEKWLTALRSGEYKQGDEGLLLSFSNDEDGNEIKSYCCLGVGAVICKVPSSELVTEWIDDFKEVPEEITGSINKLPNVLAHLNDGFTIGNYSQLLKEDDGEDYEPFIFRHFDIHQEFLIKNVIKLDFNQIADFIEDNCEFYDAVEQIKN